MPSIFVQIPSYRDLELSKTIYSAIQNASSQNQINFGISNVVSHEKEIFLTKNYPKWVKIKSKTSITPENLGVLKSRKIANSFYDQEEYYLQTDSHMRFAKNWDTDLINIIEQYKNIGFKKPLVSMYPASYWYDDFFKEHRSNPNGATCVFFTENKKQFEETYIPSQTAHSVSPECTYTASISGAFIFTVGNFGLITPNEKIAFWGEEILTAARAFTNGFDLLLCDKSYLFHLYYNHDKPYQLNGRRHVWSDFPQLWDSLEVESKKEINRIFSNEIIGLNELGSERSLEDYSVYSGLDFKNKKVVQSKWG